MAEQQANIHIDILPVTLFLTSKILDIKMENGFILSPCCFSKKPKQYFYLSLEDHWWCQTYF